MAKKPTKPKRAPARGKSATKQSGDNADRILAMRAFVAMLRSQGQSQSEVYRLCKMDFGASKRAVDNRVKEIKAAREAWTERNLDDILVRLLADAEALLHEAWTCGNLETARKLLMDIADLLGLKKINIKHNMDTGLKDALLDRYVIQHEDEADLDLTVPD